MGHSGQLADHKLKRLDLIALRLAIYSYVATLCAKQPIKQTRANAEACTWLAVMMCKMMSAQTAQDAVPCVAMVQGIVDAVVSKIPCHHTSKNGQCRPLCTAELLQNEQVNDTASRGCFSVFQAVNMVWASFWQSFQFWGFYTTSTTDACNRPRIASHPHCITIAVLLTFAFYKC